MPTTQIQGGYVEAWFAGDGANGQLQLHAQKFTTAGQKVGAEYVAAAADQTLEVAATYNAGYVLGFNGSGTGNVLFVPFDERGVQQQMVSKAASDFNLAASPDGGFLISWMGPATWANGSPDAPHVGRFQLFDAWGGSRTNAVQVGGGLPSITVQGDGDYALSWTDGEFSHSAEVDPQAPPSFQPIYGSSGFSMLDDVAPATGGTYNIPLNDPSPQVRLMVSQTGYFDMEVGDTKFSGGERRVLVTAEDVARGYKIVDLGTFAEGKYYGQLEFTASNGLAQEYLGGFFFEIDMTAPPKPSLSIIDDVGPATGAIASGGTTDDANPTVRLHLPTGVAPGDYHTVYLDGQAIRPEQLVQYSAISQGYLDIALNRNLPAGSYTLTAEVRDGAHNSATAETFTFTVSGSAPGGGPSIYGPTPRLAYVHERNLRNGTAPDAGALTQTATLRLSAPAGVDDFSLAGRSVIQDGVFTPVTVTTAYGPLAIRSFDGSTGDLLIAFTLDKPAQQTVGPEITLVSLRAELTDKAGAMATNTFRFDITNDSPITREDTDVAAVAQPPATGNVLTDASAGDAGDADDGADRMGADGGRIVAIMEGRLNDQGVRDDSPDANGDFQVNGRYGTLTVNLSGAYSYVVRSDAPSNVFDTFDYYIQDGDVNGTTGRLTIHVTQGAAPPEDPPPDPSQGRVLTSDQYADTLTGGAGTDTLIAGRGPDQLTGGGGADHFVWKDLPWNAGVVTDFADGADRLDLTALYAEFGYSGADSVADRWVSFEADGAGGTRVLFDTDGPGATQSWSYLITTVRSVAPASLSAADLVGQTGGNETQPGGGDTEPGAGQVLTSDQYGDTLTGGSGDDTLNAGQGPDQLTGGGGEDTFAFAKTPWNAGVITDFTPNVDLLDLSMIFRDAGYAGPDPVATRWLILEGSGADTKVYVDIDGPDRGEWPFLITTLKGLTPSQLSYNDWIT